MKSLKQKFQEIQACQDAIDLSEGKSAAGLYAQITRPDWIAVWHVLTNPSAIPQLLNVLENVAFDIESKADAGALPVWFWETKADIQRISKMNVLSENKRIAFDVTRVAQNLNSLIEKGPPLVARIKQAFPNPNWSEDSE